MTAAAPRKPWAAALMSAAFPGLGLLYVGRPGWALAAAFGPIVLMALAEAAGTVWLHLLVPLLLAFSGLYGAAWFSQVVLSWVFARRSGAYRLRRYNRLLAYVAFLVCTWSGKVLLAGNVRALWVEPFRVQSTSMMPSVGDGDHFFAVKGGPASRWVRGDVVVVDTPGVAGSRNVQRVIAIGPGRVQVTGREVRVNGRVLAQRPCSTPLLQLELEGQRWELDCVRETSADGLEYPVVYDRREQHARHDVDVELAAGEVFVMGDHRDNSNDSRFTRPSTRGEVVGRASPVWMSTDGFTVRFDRIGRTFFEEP